MSAQDSAEPRTISSTTQAPLKPPIPAQASELNASSFAMNSSSGRSIQRLDYGRVSPPGSNMNMSAISSLSAAPFRQYSQLPTPQSPNNFGHYAHVETYTTGSPISQGYGYPPQMADPTPLAILHYSPRASHPPLTSTPVRQRLTSHRPLRVTEEAINPISQQTVTPETSPFAQATPRYNHTSTPQFYSPPHSDETATLKANSSPIKLEPPVSLASSPRLSSPVASIPESHSSRLSSPFMAKLSISGKTTKAKNPGQSRSQSYLPELRSTPNDDVFTQTLAVSGLDSSQRQIEPAISTPPLSPSPHIENRVGPTTGGEMERIRQVIMQDRLAHYQEAESRRPEYLKRAKRTLSEADPAALAEDEKIREQERVMAVGIMESPNKGRRLKLFQETSEESFEESLMAGGYGRYRTAEWVRQPQPITLLTPGPAGPSNVTSVLEAAEPVPPTEKELKKQKRLAAFRRERTPYDEHTKLYAVELEGRGRVLLDVPAEAQIATFAPEPPASKKKGNRRKKKAPEPTAKEKKAAVAAEVEDVIYKPNWPDAEFPWKLRTEERADLAKAKEEERLRWIERFLDRTSDDEDDEDVAPTYIESRRSGGPTDSHGDMPSQPPRPGRGKMVPLPTNPLIPIPQMRRRSSFFPSDPADARAALLSKKSVRALSYRQKRRQRRAEDDSDDEVVCICNGRVDGRELVQCDGCEAWYHLQCIGIRNIAELGKEEDPWFCKECEARSRSMSPDPQATHNEPTFVPTDEEPRRSLSYDPSFYQPSLQDSPMTWNSPRMPKTPTRSGADRDRGTSSGSSWVESSQHGPSTPQHPSYNVKVYTDGNISSFEPYSHSHDESPFDPASTPSRGIKFGAPFATPKNNVWSTRANGLFQTPSKPSSRKTFGGPGTLSSALDDSGGGSFSSSPIYAYDDSPIRRTKSGETARDRRVMVSPLASRSLSSLPPPHLLEESPIMRYHGKERRRDSLRALFD